MYGPLPKPNQIPELAPYTVVHSYATKLRANQAKNEPPLEIRPHIFTTRQGLPVVIFKKDDFMNKLASKMQVHLGWKIFQYYAQDGAN